MAVCDSRLESIVGDLPVLQASMRSRNGRPAMPPRAI